MKSDIFCFFCARGQDEIPSCSSRSREINDWLLSERCGWSVSPCPLPQLVETVIFNKNPEETINHRMKFIRYTLQGLPTGAIGIISGVSLFHIVPLNEEPLSSRLIHYLILDNAAPSAQTLQVIAVPILGCCALGERHTTCKLRTSGPTSYV
jgi:hypothetical protein